MGFLPEPLFQLLNSHALRIYITQYNCFISIPHIQDTSEKIGKAPNEAWVKVTIKPFIHTISQILSSLKP